MIAVRITIGLIMTVIAVAIAGRRVAWLGRLGQVGQPAPGRTDDELLGFDNVVLSPHIAAQPRFNALEDLAELMQGLSRELAA